MFAPAQSLKNLVNQPPDGALIGFLLTDGTVIVQGNACSDWWKLTPDINGSYVRGTWKQMASLPLGYVPLYFASAVLADGRVIIEGGEYQNFQFAFTDKGAIYDPLKNTWKSVKPPAGWGFIGDSPSVLLPDGKFLLGRKFNKRMAILDPATLAWTEVSSAGKHDENAEEGWTLMPDGSVLTVDVKGNPISEKYIPSMSEWVTAGKTPTNLQGPPQVGCIPYGHNKEYCPREKLGQPFCGRTARCLRLARCIKTRRRGTPRFISPEQNLQIRAHGRPAPTFPTAMPPVIRMPPF